MNFEKLFGQIQNPSAAQQQAFTRFQALGLPTKKLEDWHYTSVKTVFETERVLTNGSAAISSEMKAKLDLVRLPNQMNVVFVDGHLSEQLSDRGADSLVKAKSDTKEASVSDGMTALASAFRNVHYTVDIGSESVLSQVVQFVFLSTTSSFSAPSLEVIVGRRSKVELVSSFISAEGAQSVSLPSISAQISESSICKWTHIEYSSLDSHVFSQIQFQLQNSSQLQYLNFSVGGGIVRQSLEVDVRGADVLAHVNGIAVLQQQQHLDNTTSINHHVGGSQTYQLYKGILDGQSRSAFSGKVYIAKDAQKAFSEQLNNNLLLSSQAEADSRPMLQIYADDVKAGHGSTVGQLNAEEIFYLQSRAIPKSQAVQMLAYGFVTDLILKQETKVLEPVLNKILETCFRGIKVV